MHSFCPHSPLSLGHISWPYYPLIYRAIALLLILNPSGTVNLPDIMRGLHVSVVFHATLFALIGSLVGGRLDLFAGGKEYYAPDRGSVVLGNKFHFLTTECVVDFVHLWHVILFVNG